MSPLCLVGVEDGSFQAFKFKDSTLLCAVCMVENRVEWVRLGKVTVDGRDVTRVLLKLIKGARFDALILGGISFAGFNVLDPHKLFDELGVPIIIYIGEMPDMSSTLVALRENFTDWVDRWSPIMRLGDIYSTVTKTGLPPVFFEVLGCSSEWGEEVLRASVSLTRMPESIRLAGTIARGLTKSA